MNPTDGSACATLHASPDDMILSMEACVRAEPTVASHRWAMSQALCVQGDWQRALQQLRAYGSLDRTKELLVQTVRGLIRAERWREQVMAGTHTPALIYDDVPVWMSALLDALKHAARGDLEAADRSREDALDAAPLVPMSTGSERFEWVGESDSRFGPVYEIIVAGSYRWIALMDLASWRIRPPSGLIDLVWAPCTAILKDGTVLHGFSPARYPVSENAPIEEREALLMGKKTVWRDTGRTGVFGSGLRTWATSNGDFSIFELSECRFDVDTPFEGIGA
jgi:type VI secretion system protein ImpE